MVTWNVDAFTTARNYVFANQQNCDDRLTPEDSIAPALAVAHSFQRVYNLSMNGQPVTTPGELSERANNVEGPIQTLIDSIYDFCTIFFENLPQINQNISQKKRAMRAFLIKYYFINTYDQILQETAIEEAWQKHAQLCYVLFFVIHIFPKSSDFPTNNLHKNILFDLKTRLWKHYDSAKINIPESDQEKFKIATAGLASYSGAFPETTGARKLNDSRALQKFERPKACLPKEELEEEENDRIKLEGKNIPRLCILTLQPLRKGYNVDHLQCWADIFEVLKGLLKVSSASKKCTTIEVSYPKFTLTGRWNNTIKPDSSKFRTCYKIAKDCIKPIKSYFLCNISNLVLANKAANDAKGSQSLFEYFMDKPLYYLLGDKFVENTNCFASLQDGKIVAEYYKEWVHTNVLFYKIHRAVKKAGNNKNWESAWKSAWKKAWKKAWNKGRNKGRNKEARTKAMDKAVMEAGMRGAMQDDLNKTGIQDSMHAVMEAGMQDVITESAKKTMKLALQTAMKASQDAIRAKKLDRAAAVVPKFAKILSQLRDKKGHDVCPDILPNEHDIQEWIDKYDIINLNTNSMQWERKKFSPNPDEKKTIEKVFKILKRTTKHPPIMYSREKVIP